MQGTLEVLYSMQNILAEIGGMDTVAASSLPPALTASFSGLMLIKAYHDDHAQGHRDTILVPEAAHGTNPASAARCGYKTVTVKSDGRGRVDLAHLENLADDHVAGLDADKPEHAGPV